MKLSTLRLTKEIQLVAERFVKSDDTVHLQLSIKHNGHTLISERDQVCKIGIGDEAKDIRYFKQIGKSIEEITSNFIARMEATDLLQHIYIEEETIITFILGGIFDSY